MLSVEFSAILIILINSLLILASLNNSIPVELLIALSSTLSAIIGMLTRTSRKDK